MELHSVGIRTIRNNIILTIGECSGELVKDKKKQTAIIKHVR